MTHAEPSIHADVVVVGGGPGGAAAAVTLARGGLDTVVVDKARFPRDKICGDGLTVWALRQLDELGFDPSAVPSWHQVRKAVVSSPSRHEIELPLPEDGTFAAVARRRELDAAVLELAERAGAIVLTGSEVLTLAQDDRCVTLTTRDEQVLQARFVVAADGMWSTVRKLTAATLPGYRGEWHAFRQYFHNVTGPGAQELFAWFEPDFLPGYAWSFPVGVNEANVGFGIMRGGAWRVGAMGELWREILARPHIRDVLGPRSTPQESPRAWPIPARVEGISATAGRVLFVGDAVAAADPLTGEGIGQAYATGRWAAEAILERGAANIADPVREQYERQLHDRLLADHRMSLLLVRAMRHRKGARSAIRLAGLSPWTRRNFGRWLFEDYPRALVFTPSRWHRGRMAGPGAFGSRPPG